MAGPNLRELLGIRPDFVEVEVLGVNTLAGEPLPVRCLKPPRKEVVERMRVLPGARPGLREEDLTPDEQFAVIEETAKAAAPWLAVQLPDGTWHAPAFSFDEEVPEDLIPASQLTMPDLMKLGMAFLYLSGFVGGAAIESFRRK